MTFLTAHEIKYLTEKYPEREFVAKFFVIQENVEPHAVVMSFSFEESLNLENLGNYYIVALLSDKELLEEIGIKLSKTCYDYDERMRIESQVEDFSDALGQEYLLIV